MPHEAPARRAERRPDGDLPPPHRRAREQQVRHVGTRDEEHHGHGAGEGDEEGPRIADHEALQGEETDVLVRPHGLLQPASEGHGPLLGLREAKPGAQAPEHVQGHLVRIAEPGEGLLAGGGRRQTGGEKVALPHLQVEAQLVVDVRRDVRSPEAQIAPPAGLLMHVRPPTARLRARR